MKKICGIGFKEVGKIYWFETKGMNVKVGDYVVVETVRGQELGHVIKPVEEADEAKLEHFCKTIEACKQKGEWSRGELIDLFNYMIPNFNHKKTGKFLDGRM